METSWMWLLVGPRSWRSITTLVQVVSSLLISSIAFATFMLVRFFWNLSAGDGGYRLLSLALVGLLLVPLISLGSASAKLSVQSRNDRLAVLRLLGMAESRVRMLAVAEASIIQGIGIGIAFFLSFLSPYLLSLLPIQGSPIGWEDLHLPLELRLLIFLVLILLSIWSSQLGLRRLILTPLGVKQRSQQTKLSAFRLVVMIVFLVGGLILLHLASPSWGVLGIMFALVLVLTIIMGALNLVGPYLVYLFAKRRVGKAKGVAHLIAARRNLDDPKGAWRLVSSIAFTSFVLVPTGAMLGFLAAVGKGPSQLEASLIQLLADTRTVLLLVVFLSFLLVACQVAFTQLIELFEHADLYVALDRIGTPKQLMNQSRYHQILLPSLIASIGSALLAVILCFPLVSVAATVSPLFVLLIIVLLALGNGLILWSVQLTNPVLSHIVFSSVRDD